MILVLVLGIYFLIACGIIALVVWWLDRTTDPQCDKCGKYCTDEEIEYGNKTFSNIEQPVVIQWQKCYVCLLEETANAN